MQYECLQVALFRCLFGLDGFTARGSSSSFSLYSKQTRQKKNTILPMFFFPTGVTGHRLLKIVKHFVNWLLVDSRRLGKTKKSS